MWKYLLFGSEQWQEIASVRRFAFGQLKFNDNQYFFVGDGFSSPYNLQLYKVTIGNTAVDWAAQILWSSGSWISYDSDSILSSDQSILYSIFIFGSTSRLYLNKLQSVASYFYYTNKMSQKFLNKLMYFTLFLNIIL